MGFEGNGMGEGKEVSNAEGGGGIFTGVEISGFASEFYVLQVWTALFRYELVIGSIIGTSGLGFIDFTSE